MDNIEIEEKSSVISVSVEKQLASNNLTEEGLVDTIFKGSLKEAGELMQM